MIIAQKLRQIAADLIGIADSLQEKQTTETIGKATFSRSTHIAVLGKIKYQLTKSQAKILIALLDNRGVILDRDDLMTLLFGQDSLNFTSRTIDQHITNLRGILGRDAITTIHRRGYIIK